ncbi:MAG: transketolase C-terminal domain-containing protein [Acidimicrobiales bacterium]
MPVLEHTNAAGVAGGAYALSDPDDARITLAGSGSEVSVCLDAAGLLAAQDIVARVVSMPCWELFEDRSPQERDLVLRPDLPSLGVEAGSSMGWHRWVDDVVSIDRFGASAPGDTVMRELGISPDNVAERARALLGGSR